MSGGHSQFGLDVGGANNFGPAFGFRFDDGSELVRGIRHWHETDGIQARFHVGQCHDPHDFPVQ